MSANSEFSDQYKNDLFQSLLKNDKGTKYRTTMNAEMLQMEPNSSDLSNKEQSFGVIEFDEPKIKQTSNENNIMIEQNFDSFQEISESKQISEPKQAQLQKTQEHKYINNSCSQEIKEIFKTKTIRKEGKKNTNLPKFLVRILMKYFKETEDSPEGRQKFQEIILNFKNKKTNNYKIADILELFCHNDQNQNLGSLNRRVMRKILRSKLKEEIILNSYVTNNRLTYMLTAKVFALRCRSKILTERLQFR